MRKNRATLKNKRWIDYALAFSIGLMVTVLLGFVFIDDVQDGVIAVGTMIVEWLFPDLFV